MAFCFFLSLYAQLAHWCSGIVSPPGGAFCGGDLSRLSGAHTGELSAVSGSVRASRCSVIYYYEDSTLVSEYGISSLYRGGSNFSITTNILVAVSFFELFFTK